MSSSGPPMAKPKGLLDSIEGFKKGGLKKTKTVDKSAPAIEGKGTRFVKVAPVLTFLIFLLLCILFVFVIICL